MEKNEERAKPGRPSGSFLTVFRYSDRRDTVLMILGTIGCIADGSSTPIIMLVLSKVMDKYSLGTTFTLGDVNKNAISLLYVAVAVALGAFLEGLCWARTAERQTSRLRIKYLRAMLRQEASFLDTQHGTSTTYQVVSSISTDTITILSVLSEKVPNFLMNVSTFISAQAAAVYLCWRLAAATIPLLLLLIVPGMVYGKLLAGLAEQIQEAYGVAGGIAEQTFSSIRTVLSYVAEHQTERRFSDALEKNLELGIKQGLMKGLAIGSVGVAFAVWSFQAWYGSVMVIEKRAIGGDVFTAGVCIVVGGLALGGSLVNVKYFAEAAIAATLISEMIERVPSIDADDQDGKTIMDVKGELSFKNVEFAYPSRPGTLVLKKFNLQVTPSQTVGLVGGSGSGKSTIISLIERFYDPLEGEILLDGLNIKDLQLKWLRSQIGLVSQEPVLFATSIKENILLGKQGASMEEVTEASKAANAHNFISQLPDGYNTQVGQSGSQMSGGQKQRIAIARALLKDPRILLLDEATSALDSKSEKVVQDALDQASVGRTTIIVAHRLSTLRNADLIAVMQSGQVVECGSHDQLIENVHGQYSAMLQLQLHQTTHPGEEGTSLTASLPIDSPLCSSKDPNNSEVLNKPSPSQIPDSDIKTNHHEEDASSTPSLWHLVQMTTPQWNKTLMACSAAFCFGAIQPVQSFCMGALLYVYFLNDNNEIQTHIKTYCYAFLLVGIATFITSLTQHFYFGVVGEHLTRRVREAMLAKVLTFEIEWFDQANNSSGALCSRLDREANMVRSLVCDRLSLLTQITSAVILAVTLSMALAWKLAIVIISLQPVIIGSFYARGVLMTNMSKKVLESQSNSSNLASEAIRNHRTIAAFSSEEKIMGLFEASLGGPKKESKKQSWYAGIGLSISQFIFGTNAALIIWHGGRLLFHGTITYKHLFQTFFILVTTGRVIAEAGMLTSDLSKGRDSVKSVFMILKRKSKMVPDDPEGIKPEKIKGDIEIKELDFHYPSRPNHKIFTSLSLKVDTGKTVALVGQSGSGKSTIIGLIERFYDPVKGSVLIDGINIKSYNLRALRSHIALVSQEPALFSCTIQENITYGKENVTEAEIIEAATLANAHEFISYMKEGYSTYCGERGQQLSGGQKQRIAIARAILKNPAILLLDEATSALDSRSESLVQDALEKIMLGRTCVVVAHRLSTIQKSDTIVVTENGRIVESGSHTELFAKGEMSSYYSLVRLQQSDSSGGSTPQNLSAEALN